MRFFSVILVMYNESTEREVMGEEKLVFETESILDKKSYRWVMTRYNMKNMIISRIIFVICPVYGIFLLTSFGGRMLSLAAILILVGAMVNFKYYILIPKQIDKIVETFEKNGEHKNAYHFYETYVERENATGNMIIKYENLSALRETDTFFAFWSEPNKVIILNKENISESHYDFLRNIVPADMSEAYERKFKKRFIISASVLGIIVIGLIAMLFMTFVL